MASNLGRTVVLSVGIDLELFDGVGVIGICIPLADKNIEIGEC